MPRQLCDELRTRIILLAILLSDWFFVSTVPSISFHRSFPHLFIYRVIQSDCRGCNNLSYTINLRYQYMYFFIYFLLHTLKEFHMCTLCDSTNINTIIDNHRWHATDSLERTRLSCWCLLNHKGCTYRAPVNYVTKTWSVVLLNKKYIYSYLKCIVYDKLLKSRQSFWITLYLFTNFYRKHLTTCHCLLNNFCSFVFAWKLADKNLWPPIHLTLEAATAMTFSVALVRYLWRLSIVRSSVGRSTTVGTATRYVPGGSLIESRWRQTFPHKSK